MSDFVVHLRDAEVDRYARISFEVELGGEADRAKFERYTARVRDGFIAYLSDRTLEDLRGSEQTRKQKAALSGAAQGAGPRGADPRPLHHRPRHPVRRGPWPRR